VRYPLFTLVSDSRLYKFEICPPSHEDIYIGYLQVEIDLLTGATTILRSDLIYDCGQSLNPAVDLGQVGIVSLNSNWCTMCSLTNDATSLIGQSELSHVKSSCHSR
jgi:xanthine dehydrogenase molybdopterin-binding subunit B